jgi:hypothetical protein
MNRVSAAVVVSRCQQVQEGGLKRGLLSCTDICGKLVGFSWMWRSIGGEAHLPALR